MMWVRAAFSIIHELKSLLFRLFLSNLEYIVALGKVADLASVFVVVINAGTLH